MARYLPKRPPDPDKIQRWLTFLRNHREGMVGVDFLVVPTALFRMLYVLVFLEHGRRRVVHAAVTEHPTAEWVVRQFRQAFPYDTAPKYVILDRDSIFNEQVAAAIRSMGTTLVRPAFRSPWQNPFVERFNGTLRRELLDHVVVLSDTHLRRLLREFLAYYHEDRCHLGLAKDAPVTRPATPRPALDAELVALPRVGGIHHRYVWCESA